MTPVDVVADRGRAGKGVATTPLLEVEGLRKAYADTAVFDQVNLALARGEFVALLGESGVGKSTLLNCIAGLDDADAGRIVLTSRDGARHEVTTLGDDARALLRRRHLGFVFQAFHVLPHLSVAENVELPLRLLGRADDAAGRTRVDELLHAVGLEALHAREPSQLSGGQLQRVAIARALVHQPALLLADEPTGNLDPVTAERVLELLRAQTRGHGTACLLVTHSRAAARHADRVLELTGRGIVDERSIAAPVGAALDSPRSAGSHAGD
jgi:putative ABC transport system ATP-binding protein